MRDFGFCNKFIRYSFTNLEFRIHKFSLNICYDLFFNWQTGKKNCFGPIRNLFSFSTAQTEKNSLKKLVKKYVFLFQATNVPLQIDVRLQLNLQVPR